MKSSLTVLILLVANLLLAQNPEITYELKHTSIKNQHFTGTCWIFATTSFIESEILRKYDVYLDLSEEYINYFSLIRKTQEAIMPNSDFVFTEGGFSQLEFDMWQKYGIVQENDYPFTLTVQRKLTKEMESFIDKIRKNEIDTLKINWTDSLKNILKKYLDNPPTTITYENQQLTPKKFANKWKLDFNDYVFLTSFKRFPFYQNTTIDFNEKYDWTHQKYYNVPIDTLILIMENAVKNGYSIAIDLLIDSYNFKFNNGFADISIPEDSDFQNIRERILPESHNVMEKDHIMHIVGLAETDDGKKYFYTKNSWGTYSKQNGYMFISYEYFKIFGIYAVMHKDAVDMKIPDK